MRYVPLVELLLEHPYHPDGRCPDLALEPADATTRLLRNHRCVLRRRPDGVGVLIAQDPSGEPFLRLAGGAELLFHLRLRSREFALFTDLDELRGHLAPEYTNIGLAPGDEQLLLVSGQRRHDETWVLDGPSAALRRLLGVEPLAGSLPGDFRIRGTSSPITVDGYDAATRTLTLGAASAVADDRVTIDYPVRPRLPRGVLAAARIRHDGGAAPRQYRVVFRPRQARWSYYLVTDLETEAGKLAVVDHQPANGETPLGFGAATRLAPGPDPADRIATQLAEQHPELDYYRFVSDAPVACRAAARRHLELQLDGQRIAGPLPNPAPTCFSTLELPAGEAPSQEASLYQVVRYVTRPLPTTGE